MPVTGNKHSWLGVNTNYKQTDLVSRFYNSAVLKIKRILKSSPAGNYRNIMTGVNAPFLLTSSRVDIEMVV